VIELEIKIFQKINIFGLLITPTRSPALHPSATSCWQVYIEAF
jgi:hypothetical protein